jgi:hypothetical protein
MESIKDDKDILYMNLDTGEYYIQSFKYCRGCGKEIVEGQDKGTEYDRETGELIPGNKYLGCPDLANPMMATWIFTEHDKWTEVDMSELTSS